MSKFFAKITKNGYNREKLNKLIKNDMGKDLEKISSGKYIIENQLKEFNEKLLSNLPSLEWENWFGDRARDVMFLLGLDKNFNPSRYVEALAKARESQKSVNNPDYKNLEKKSA